MAIDSEIVKKQKTEAETANINSQLLQIKYTIHSMCHDLKVRHEFQLYISCFLNTSLVCKKLF